MAKLIKQSDLAPTAPKLQSTVPSQTPKQPEPVEEHEPLSLREFGDSHTTRKAVYDNVMKAAKSLQPVSNARYSLQLSEPHWADPEHRSIAERKHAVLHGESLYRRLRGTWQLKDIEGKVVAEKKSTVAQIPHMTEQGTFVLNGTEYSLSHQQRLRPGIYHREKENGDIEAHINIMPGQGLSHRYFLEPKTGIFKINIGQSNMPLMPVLRAMGANEDEIKKAWGPELYYNNDSKADPRTIDKLYEKLIGRKGNPNATRIEKAEAIGKSLGSMKIDPEVTKITLGQAHHNLNKDAALATTKKLLSISKGEADTDDRDHLAFQHFYGPEDLISERIHRSHPIMRDLLWKATTKGNLDTLPSNAFTKHVHDAILGSGLGQALEETNALDILDQQTRVTRMGLGGIASTSAIPDESRNVNPSQLNYVDILRTPESLAVGVDTRTAAAARKGSDKRLYSPYLNPRTGQVVYKSPQDVSNSVIAFPNEMSKNEPVVAALVGGKATYVPRNKVEYVMPHMEHTFSPINNLIPMKSAIHGQRASMASRFTTQALPLREGEAPFVRGQVPGMTGRSYEEHYGKYTGAVHAHNIGGRVIKVTPDDITVRYDNGHVEKHDLYNNFPFARKSFIHNTALVRPGDTIKPGQLLAKSNHTDDLGHIALGKNLRVAYIPTGHNYEDAIEISESAAKKLNSENMYQHGLEWDDRHRKGKKAYVSIFPSVHNRKKLSKVDDDGVVKPGEIVEPGDPLILAAKEREFSRKQVHAAHKGSFADDSVVWDHHSPGIVTDAAKTGKGVLVTVKSYNPMQIGDKMSDRHASKGVIGNIRKDEEMPHDAQGRPYEVLLNPLGMISRRNPAQLIEAALGKISEKTGKPYVLEDFSHINDLTEFAENELNRHNLQAAEDIIDPKTGKKIPGVMTGNRFFMKLHHTSESKGQGRGIGSYTSEDIPAKGGAEGSKRVASQDLHALLSHGAIEALRDAKLVRGQKNQEYWAAFMSGYRPPTPNVPKVYDKFVNQLKGSGINVERQGTQLHIMALTDRHINKLAGDHVITSGDTVDWKEGMKEVPGGLFDIKATGGHLGNRWAKIPLHEAMPSPVFEEPIRALLDLTQKEFMDVLTGRAPLGASSGPKAIHDALKKINVNQAISQARADIGATRGNARNTAIKRLGYLTGAQKSGTHPSDWMLSSVPVIPPLYRPVSKMVGTGGRLISDPNYLYKEVLDANDNLKNLHGKIDDLSQERESLYNAFKGVVGLGDPVQPKNRERRVKGFLAQIFSHSPKYSVLQQKLLGASVDLVGRAVITPNPDLNMDQVGLPETRAWEVYSPFVIRRLVKRGVPKLQAMEYVRDRHDIAKKALLEEVNERPVIVTRAPVLHRYGEMAFFPRITKGDTLQISPIVTRGFGADFDGDTQNYHVPATDEAAKELVEKLLPSKNLLGVNTFKATTYLPTMEYLGGLYASTRPADHTKRPRVFATRSDAIQAIHRGELDPKDPIEIVNH